MCQILSEKLLLSNNQFLFFQGGGANLEAVLGAAACFKRDFSRGTNSHQLTAGRSFFQGHNRVNKIRYID